MDDQPLGICDQHAFTGAIKHGRRLAQTLTIFSSFRQFLAYSLAT